MKAILDVRVVKRINIGKYAQIVTAGSEPGFAGSQSHIECPLVLYISTSVWVLRIVVETAFLHLKLVKKCEKSEKADFDQYPMLVVIYNT